MINVRLRSGFWMLALLCFAVSPWSAVAQSPTDTQRLAAQLAPLWQGLTDSSEPFAVAFEAEIELDDQSQEVRGQVVRYDATAFDLDILHNDYSLRIRRRDHATALALPHHRTFFYGSGDVDSVDHLAPRGLSQRLVSTGSQIWLAASMLEHADSDAIAALLTSALKVRAGERADSWRTDEQTTLRCDPAEGRWNVSIDGRHRLSLRLSDPQTSPPAADDWPEFQRVEVPRDELERTLARGTRRALEILAPSRLLTDPPQRERIVEHGQLRWIDGQRVALLHGTPEQVGRAHGELLAREATRCIDSVLYTFGTVNTVRTGRWFRHDLDAAYQRLAPFIPADHRRETVAFAAAAGVQPHTAEILNVFPELFHCSGFALFGRATVDGKLYHGRVLDYMTTIGLQDAATTFVVAIDGKHAFANIGYAGFIGSVSGMNDQAISLGEMGGKGEGQWDGVPMATLMRRALEECSTLDEVQQLWKDSPRTCEYYYVFADGKSQQAVGVMAVPESVTFIQPGQTHPRLGEGIADAVVLSAGSRLETLRARVQEKYGQVDTEVAKWLMTRPVAMKSNLHNVLFVPQDGVLYVANATHDQPAANQPYAEINLTQLLAEIGEKADGTDAAKVSFLPQTRFEARDTLAPAPDPQPDAQRCLDDLCWTGGRFEVRCQPPLPHPGDALVTFPSPIPSGDADNDRVSMEWYLARDEAGGPRRAPAVVVVHETGSRMTAGRVFARGFQAAGVHAFLVHLPYYGARRPTGQSLDKTQVVRAMRQAVADVRRARDAVAVLPFVDAESVSLQGTSLGGIVAATVAGLDGGSADSGYDRVFLMLAGGDLLDIIRNGKKDAAGYRRALRQSGLSADEIAALAAQVEPTRIAHRMDGNRTWLYSALQDEVVPIKNAMLLAQCIGLPEPHHVRMRANHYSGAIYIPFVLAQMVQAIEMPDGS
ncbi:C45 family autoproteolytic acyltransferase/hydolase [Roseimaritima sediminicola]|uniref:C45 family autoproteolytic acyltransferase/hydolase n=1 Tax=Roseimaritima sediminicola TaxID=2662066 RepID=UPI0012984B4D|nr:C45 family autoproteolytic acyltransferase/hydolase [Roseimaritima sediminicola]